MTSRQTIYVHPNSEIGQLMTSMRRSEDQQIETENQNLISQIDKMVKDEKIDPKRKVELFCNVLAHMFQSKMNWSFVTEGRHKKAEDFLLTKWLEMKSIVTTPPLDIIGIRDAKLEIVGANLHDDLIKQKWNEFVTRCLP